MPRKRYNKRNAAKADASGAPEATPQDKGESQQTAASSGHTWEPMFKALARRGGVVLVNVNGMGRQGFCATLTALFILIALHWQAWALSTPDSFARFSTGFTAVIVLLPLSVIVIRWLLRPKLLVALSHGGVVGLRVTGEAEWQPPEALREYGHQVNLSPDNSQMHQATHTLGLGTRTLTISALFLDPLAARLDKPLERLFDDVWQHAFQHWSTTVRPGAPSTALRHVLEPVIGWPRTFLRAPILAFYSLPFRPIWLMWRIAHQSVDGMLGACFAWTLMRQGNHAPQGADWCPPQAPYHPPDPDAVGESEPAMRPSQALVRLTSHLLHVTLTPGLAVAFAYLLFDIAATPSRDILFIDAGPGWGFRAGLTLAALLALAGFGHVVGRIVQSLGTRWSLGSLHTEWLVAQGGALLIALTAIWLAEGGLSARKINTYFDRAPGSPIQGDIVATDSFIKEPTSFMTLDDWTPSWCSDRPLSTYFPIERTTPTIGSPRLHPTTRKLRGPHDSCMQAGATLTVNWVKGTYRRTLGEQSQVVRHHPLPEEIPARLCGRHHVGSLGLRYVDQLHGCDPT